MAKTKIDLPEKYSFSTVVDIQIYHINYGGHVGNDSFLSILHEARIRFYNENGFGELVDDIVLLMSDSYIQYKKEVFHGEQLKVYVQAGNFRKISFDIYYKIENEKNEIVLLARTGIACAHTKEKKLVNIPNKVINKLR